MTPMPRWSSLAACMALLSTPAMAEPTHVMIRALSEDAKFIGDHTGGVEVTLRDARTHRVLSQGMIHGGTGILACVVRLPVVMPNPRRSDGNGPS